MSASPLSKTDPSNPTETRPRVISPRRALPGSRAVVGGVLVATAILGTFAATAQSDNANTVEVVVANRDVAPGTRLQPGDVRVAKVEMSSALAERLVRSPAKIGGATTLAPLTSGDLIHSSSIAASAGITPYLEVSFSVSAARALDGTLRPGETVDVLATDKSAATPMARVAAANARVLRTQTGGGGIGQSGEVTVTLGVASKLDAASITAAVDLGQVTLVRTTGVTSNG